MLKFQKELILDIILLIIGITCISLFYNNNSLLLSLLIISWIWAIFLWHKKEDILTFVFSGIVGSASEIVAIYFGAWSYANPTFLGIPVWLPLGWGFVVVLIRRLVICFEHGYK